MPVVSIIDREEYESIVAAFKEVGFPNFSEVKKEHDRARHRAKRTDRITIGKLKKAWEEGWKYNPSDSPAPPVKSFFPAFWAVDPAQSRDNLGTGDPTLSLPRDNLAQSRDNLGTGDPITQEGAEYGAPSEGVPNWHNAPQGRMRYNSDTYTQDHIHTHINDTLRPEPAPPPEPLAMPRPVPGVPPREDTPDEARALAPVRNAALEASRAIEEGRPAAALREMRLIELLSRNTEGGLIIMNRLLSALITHAEPIMIQTIKDLAEGNTGLGGAHYLKAITAAVELGKSLADITKKIQESQRLLTGSPQSISEHRVASGPTEDDDERERRLAHMKAMRQKRASLVTSGYTGDEHPQAIDVEVTTHPSVGAADIGEEGDKDEDVPTNPVKRKA